MEAKKYKTQKIVDQGKWVTDHLAPINAIMFISTGVLVPALDFMQAKLPFAAIAAFGFAGVAILFAMKLLKVPARVQIPRGLILMALFCSFIFSASAFASYKHEREGGVLASKIKGVAEFQAILLDIKNGKSDNPRVELANMGIPWDFLQFHKAAERGDTKVVSLFLAGGMPVTEHTGQHFQSIPYSVVVVGVNAPAVLDAMAQGGVELSDAGLVPSWGMAKEQVAPNLYTVAKEKNRGEVAQKLTELGVDGSGYTAWRIAKDVWDKNPKAVFFGI